MNVRLDEDDYQKVQALRRQGVVLSDLVREAIDAGYEASLQAAEPRDLGRMLEELHQRFPDPPELPPREYDVHAARAARAAVRGRLTRDRE